MKMRVIYDNGNDFAEFTYFSNYNRINAEGIENEIRQEMYKKYGKSARYFKIVQFYRIND